MTWKDNIMILKRKEDMKYIIEFSVYLGKITGIDSEYIKLAILTIFIFLIFGIIKSIIKKIYSNLPVNDKKKFFRNRKIRIILTAISFILVFLLWGEKLSGLITIISFISAGLTIAIREIIFNFFAGIYININRPFEIEDRIEIDDVMGDVISKHTLGFEILEIGKRVYGEQSTGRIIHIPNSYIFTKTLKNYTKVFKYIWDEIKIDISLDADIKKAEEILYEIVFDNETLKEIPKKMEDAVDEAILEYRIYYNNLDPIIYIKIEKSHIEMFLRYLVHPKKARGVQNEIHTRIVEEYQKGNLPLYIED